ncbi:alpha/beta hydrolase [Sphingomonas elodea]|uniref:alpha/beta hydrolase n=1 Tax=Sphingomonas elodea TaxID=179878 RepID=UPI0002630453|nr:alpha/beta hydrolase [Sphingomonas elodea]
MAVRLLTAGLLLGWASIASAQQAIPIDDSFTVSARFESDRAKHPDIRLPDLTVREGQRIWFDRRYRKIGDRELHLDVFLPPRARANGQAILWVHGGAWRSGNKSHGYAMANRLAQRGYAVLLPEFRLAPEAPYPAGLRDVNDAILWAKAHAAELGVSRERIALGGDSSGGQMAALLATTAGSGLYAPAEADTKVRALIDCDGVLDMTSPLARRFEDAAGDASSFARWVEGGFTRQAERWKTASAASHLGPHVPPTLILGSGQPRFTAGKDAVLAALARAGIRHRFFAFDYAPHTFWLYQPYLDRVVDEIDLFLRTPAPKKGSR